MKVNAFTNRYILKFQFILCHVYYFLTASYFFEDERGLFPEVQFVFDLQLPQNFQPVNSDGEVGEFYCWSIDKVCWLMM